MMNRPAGAYRLIDTHAHLDEIEDLEQALSQAREAGVAAIIAVGVDYESNQRVLQIAGDHPDFVFPALGWHPWQMREADIDRNLEFIESNADRAVAIGEVGLDYHKKVRAGADKDLQKQVFKEVLDIARKHNKPALVHSRYAWRDALDAVESAEIEKAVFHWYTGTSSVLRDIIEHGYYISATPAVEYHEEHRRAVREVPLEKMLLETDSPVVYRRDSDLEFESRPADVSRSLRGAAALKGLDEAQVATATTANALKFFGIG